MTESTASAADRIRQQPAFAELVEKRRRLSWTLIAVTLTSYFALIACVAMRPQWLTIPVGGDPYVNVGLVSACGVIILGWLTTLYYVRRANGELDQISNRLLAEVGQ